MLLIPRTSIFGAVLLTGYLGGAVATHLRIGNPLASHILFPVYIGILVWAGMALYRFPHRQARGRARIGQRGGSPPKGTWTGYAFSPARILTGSRFSRSGIGQVVYGLNAHGGL